MQTPPTSQQPGKAALRSGAIIGITLGIIHSVLTIIVTQMSANAADSAGTIINPIRITTPLYLVTPLIWIIGFLAAGAWGSKETGKISTGTMAGLFAGTFGGIVAGLGQVVATTIVVNQPTPVSTNASLLLFSGFAAIFYVMLVAIGAGAGLGAMGGLIGQSMSNVRTQPPVQPVYPQPVPYTYLPPQQMPLPQQVPLPRQPETPRAPEQ